MIPSRSFILAFILGAAAPAYAQELANVSLPAVQDGRFVATFSPWPKNDGSGLTERVTISGVAVFDRGHVYGRTKSRFIILQTCPTTKDGPRGLLVTGADSAGTDPYPGGEIYLNAGTSAKLTQRSGWLRLETITPGVEAGSARITWKDPASFTEFALPQGGFRPMMIEVRFRAKPRTGPRNAPIRCDEGAPPATQSAQAPQTAQKPASAAKAATVPVVPAAQANAAPTNVQTPAPTASATKSNFQPTDGFKPTPITPAYPFGLQSLEKTIANDPPALQQAVRAAYANVLRDSYGQYYDAGCVAHAFRERRKTDPAVSLMAGAVPAPRCIDRAKVIKMYADRINGPHAAVVTGANWVAPLWPNASAEKRALFANCIGERIADIIVVNTVNGTPVNESLPVTKFAEACKGALQ
jgi:hypothetical protein